MNDEKIPVNDAADSPPATQSADGVPIIVGIGASAGGIEAFEAFFTRLLPDIGMAFVVIQHLAPDHDSILANIIQRFTVMPVHQVINEMEVLANQVYVIPPNAMMALFNGRLQLLPPAVGIPIRLPIDYFFRSLAAAMHERSIGIILSGTASDGTLGLKSIKEVGGMIMAQDPATTIYDGMPRNAIATGLVDYILSPAAMSEKLTSYRRLALDSDRSLVTMPEKVVSESLEQILFMIRDQTGQDFTHYKESTIRRRIERLMAVNQIEKIPDYVRFLQNNSIGVEALFRDMLIGVTSFFRDAAVFESLRDLVIPQLFEKRRTNEPIRIWVPGCSTGEEAYSIAMLMREQMTALKQEYRVQIFATDIDGNAVNSARLGIYPANISLDVPEAYLKQHFLPTKDGYQITKSLREMLVFAVHSVTQDPPFSKLHLISCRNLLIYLDNELQHKVLSYFHFALAPTGYLLLGSSESLGKNDREFKAVDVHNRLFQRAHRLSTGRYSIDLPAVSNPGLLEKDRGTSARETPSASLREVTEAMLLRDWTPTVVVINHQGNMRYVHGRTGKYLEISTGETQQLDIIRSAREGLKIPLMTAIYRAITQQREIYEPGVRVEADGVESFFDLIVKPLTPTVDENLLAVFFEAITFPATAISSQEISIIPLDAHLQKNNLLQQELTDTREYLQAIIEELRSSNEEMQSMNEELQSVNEELETSQEELKAVNEELLTTNSELERKIEELTWANNDLENTLNTIQTGIILLDADNHVRRFNPAAAQVFKLNPGDTGRSIAHTVSDLNYPTLIDDLEKVFHTLVPHELDIQSKKGRWYALQMRPYRTIQNAIKGVVISFNDVTDQRQTETIEAARILGDNVFNAIREPLVLIDADLQIVNANKAFFDFMNVPSEKTLGHPLSELGDGAWNIPELVALIKGVFKDDTLIEDYEVTINLPGSGAQKIKINAQQIQASGKQAPLILLALESGVV